MDRRVQPEGTGSRPWYTDDVRVVHLNTHKSAGGAAIREIIVACPNDEIRSLRSEYRHFTRAEVPA